MRGGHARWDADGDGQAGSKKLAKILTTARMFSTRAARTGFYECDMAVQVGRPSNKAEILGMIRRYDRVKAVGIGHR